LLMNSLASKHNKKYRLKKFFLLFFESYVF
jgi:hypothetical protein